MLGEVIDLSDPGSGQLDMGAGRNLAVSFEKLKSHDRIPSKSSYSLYPAPQVTTSNPKVEPPLGRCFSGYRITQVQNIKDWRKFNRNKRLKDSAATLQSGLWSPERGFLRLHAGFSDWPLVPRATGTLEDGSLG